MNSVPGSHRNWRARFDSRQLKEIELARLYIQQFAHGTTGHNALLVIAKLADLADEYEAILNRESQ